MTRKVTDPTGLAWTVKRLVVPVGMRPFTAVEMLDSAAPRRTVVEGVDARVQDSVGAPTGPLPLGFLLLPLMLPFLPFVLLLRWRRLLPWTVEARAYPWGRRFPPVVFSYEVRGHDEARGVVHELADALGRGDGAPVITGAEAIDQAPMAHSDRRAITESHRKS
jgi:hypothetical protein